MSGTRVGRVHVIFELPKHLDVGLGSQAAPNAWPKEPLAYVEWYGALRSLPDENTAHRGTTLYRMVPFKERIQCTE